MVTRILVPLDGSAFSECVIPLVLALAVRTSRVCLDLTHVHSGNAGARTSTFEARLERDERAQMSAYLAGKAEHLREQTSAEVTTSLLDGDIVPALQSQVEQTRPDFIAMTTHGRGGVIRATTGSVAEAVIRHISIPVLLVRPDTALAYDIRPVFSRILIPVDDSDISRSIIPYLLDLAGHAGVALYLVSVVHPSPQWDGFPGTFGTEPALDRRILADACARATNHLATIRNEIHEVAGSVKTEVIVDAEAGPALLEYAAEHDIDLIALSTHAKGGLARLLTGSTADRIIRGAESPMLVFHDKNFNR